MPKCMQRGEEIVEGQATHKAHPADLHTKPQLLSAGNLAEVQNGPKGTGKQPADY